MIQLRFREYRDNYWRPWQDWSQYLSNRPAISKKIESEIKGAAGVIVFDSMSLTLAFLEGSPVYTAFTSSLSTAVMYMFELSLRNSAGVMLKQFEGIADFSTLEFSETEDSVSFDVVDKLSALAILEDKQMRVEHSLTKGNMTNLPLLNYTAGDYYLINIGTKPNCIIEIIKHQAGVDTHINCANPTFRRGSVLKVSDGNTEKLLFATGHYLAPGNNGAIMDSWINCIGDDISGQYKINDPMKEAFKVDEPNKKLTWFDEAVYGELICTEQAVIENNISKTLVRSFDAIKIIKGIVKQAWPSVEIFNKTGAAVFDIPYEYWDKLIYRNPFDSGPLDALKMLADTMRCYIFFNSEGKLVIQTKNMQTDSSAVTLDYDRSTVKRKYVWDKLADAVTINAKSWIRINGEPLEAASSLTKVPGQKPRNELKRELLVADPSVNTEVKLITYAGQQAAAHFEFYGKRHESLEITTHLDDYILTLELADQIKHNGEYYFIENMDKDSDGYSAQITAVSVVGYSYDARQVVVPLS